jgi:hypothetical protein
VQRQREEVPLTVSTRAEARQCDQSIEIVGENVVGEEVERLPLLNITYEDGTLTLLRVYAAAGD